MKRPFDFTRACVAMLAVVLALFVYSCSEKSEAFPGEDSQPTAISLAEAAGKAHNRALDILLDKLNSAKLSATRSGEDEDVPWTEDEEKAAVLAIVESLEDIDFGIAGTDSVWSELRSYIDACDENPEIEECPIEWSTEANGFIAELEDLIYTDYGDTINELELLTNIESRAFAALGQTEYENLKIITSLMRSSMVYWDENYHRWFSEQTRGRAGRWGRIVRADCEYAIGALSGGGVSFGNSWIFRISGHFGFPLRVVFAACCAAAGSITEALSHSDDVDLTTSDSMKYEFSYSITEQALRMSADSWAVNPPELRDPDDGSVEPWDPGVDEP